MKRVHLLGWATAAAVAVAGLVVAQTPPPVVGYLTPETAPVAAQILPPAPEAGSAREIQDHAIYTATRAMAGTPRWRLAVQDNDATVPATLGHFSCAMGMTLSPETQPRLTALLRRVIRDTIAAQAAAKHVFLRPRPYFIYGGEICVPRTDSLDTSTDYPSGHATWGWAAGLVLSEIAPDRATPILIRGRAFGESRAVCGMHTASAVEAGRTTGAAVVAAEHGSAEFRADVEAARQEIAAQRAAHASAPDPAACQAEAALTARTPYPY